MKKAFFLIVTTFMLTSCEAIFEAATGAQQYTIGNAYEVLLVCDNEVWESDLGQELRLTLRSGIPGLPQYEDAFVVTRISPDEFTGVKKQFRNIVYVKIDRDYYTAPALRFKRDVNASSQIIMTIQAPTIESCAAYVKENSQTIIDFLNGVEMERQKKILENNYNMEANSLTEKMFGSSIKIPLDIQGKKVGTDFIWFSDMNSTNPDIKSFAIYSYPYNGPEDFSMDNFIHMRDSMMKANVQGSDNEYVTTDRTSVTLEDQGYNERYVQVARGLWRMQNALEPWGGPFVSHSVVDEVNNRVIVVETFIFAPGKRKGDIIRKLETSLHTLELPVDKILKSTPGAKDAVIEAKK